MALMTDSEKLSAVKSILGITDTSQDTLLTTYLTIAKQEILSWRYAYSEEAPSVVPAEFEITQIYAVIAGFSQRGAENEGNHNENGISRTFHYTDMLDYVRANVPALVRVVG